MSTLKALIPAVLALSLSRAANLQTQDIFSFSTHKFPGQVVGDSRNAYVLTEGGVLVFDYGRKAWTDNLAPGSSVRSIRYSLTRSKLYAMLEGGNVLEYNTAFRRFTPASTADFEAATDVGAVPDLTGLTMGDDYFFLGDAVRDKYMRRAPLGTSRVFEYDNLWVLTRGLGPFFGSARRKQANTAWFGLDDPATFVIQPEGNDIWYGSCRQDGALVKSGSDLNGWKVYVSQLEYGFVDGCVLDVRAWKDYIWLATRKGVVRLDPRTGRFQPYSHMLGSTSLKVFALHVHQGRLYAGSESGVAWLSNPKDEFQSTEMLPGTTSPEVYELESKDKDLWAATRYGLFVDRGDGWKSLKDVSSHDVPEAYGVRIPSVRFRDSSLYWISGNKVMVKPKQQQSKVLLERDRPLRLVFDGDMLYVAFYSGVTAYDVRKRLWTDFRLEDGIPGTKVLCLKVFAGKLWIGTDTGITRINLRPYLP